MAWKRRRRWRLCSRRCKLVRVLFLLFTVCILFLWLFNRWVEPQLQAVARQQTGVALNEVVQQVIAAMDYEGSELVKVKQDEEGNIITLDYDTARLNRILQNTLETLEASLEAAQDGKEDPWTRQTYYADGIIYQIPLGYLTQIPMLAQMGPKIPVRFRMINDISAQFSFETEPYGLNNTMVRITLVLRLQANAITALSMSQIEQTLQIPLVMELVHGQVPEHYMGFGGYGQPVE